MGFGKLLGTVIGAAVGGPIGAAVGLGLGAMMDNSNNEVSFNASWKMTGNVLRLKIDLDDDDNNINNCDIFFTINDSPLKSKTDLFANDHNNFIVTHPVFDNEIYADIPIGCLLVSEGNIKNIVANIIINSEENEIGVIKLQLKLENKNLEWYPIEWIQPIIEIFKHTALDESQWKPEKVVLIKNLISEIFELDNENSKILRDHLKKSNIETLENCSNTYNLRFLNSDIDTFTLGGVVELLLLNNKSKQYLTKRIENLCSLLLVDDNVKHQVLTNASKLHDENNHSNFRDQSNNTTTNNMDIKWALDTLEIKSQISFDVIKTAYRKKINELHPDRYANSPKVILDFVNQKSIEINRARDILTESIK